MGRDGSVNGRKVRMEGRFVKSYSLGLVVRIMILFLWYNDRCSVNF